MNIFGIGTAEFVLIILIMLVVAGPQRMVRWAYVIGQYVGKLRQMWEEVVDVMQKEADAAGLNVQIPKEPPNRQNVDQWVRDVAKPYTESLQQASDDLTQPVKAAMQETRTTIQVTNKLAEGAAAVAATTVSTNDKPTRSRATKPLAPRKPPEGALAQNGADFGTWGETSTETDSKQIEADAENGMNFGAWSNPQHPGAPAGEAD